MRWRLLATGRRTNWERPTPHSNFSTNGRKSTMKTKPARGLIRFGPLFAERFRRNVSWRSCATMSISPIRRKRMTRPKWCAAIHNSLPLVSYETISSPICALLAAMVRVVPISVPPGVERPIPCCSLLASWHCVAESNWVVQQSLLSLIGKIWRLKAENCFAARNATLKTRP